jgi:tetratricopeptide (TPR) repeat protein
MSRDVVKQAGELADADKLDEAMELCNRVLLDEPDNPGVLYVIGCCLLKAARQVQAIQIAKRITHLCPNDFRGWSLLALCWGELCRYDESVRNAERALKCKRTDKTLADLAYAHTNAGNWEQADKYCREAMIEATTNPSPLANEAMTNCRVSNGYIKLAQGKWKEGFEGFRSTMRTKWRKEWAYGDSQEWMGEPDAVVMVTGEQGLGDEIMAASVILDAAKACKQFIFDCDARLATLFRRSMPGVLVTPTRREQQIVLPVMPTHHKSLFGLGELFRQKDEDFPRKPFLVADPDDVAMFRERFKGRKIIGLAWSGGLPRTGQEPRAAGLNAFAPLVKRGGEYLSLQYKCDLVEIDAFEKAHGVKIHRLPWVTQGQDMDLLAALIASLDEVIGVHTTALHLASALGVKTTTLVHRGSGWRYSGTDLIWYPPTTKLWRKETGESWRDCVERLVGQRDRLLRTEAAAVS